MRCPWAIDRVPQVRAAVFAALTWVVTFLISVTLAAAQAAKVQTQKVPQVQGPVLAANLGFQSPDPQDPAVPAPHPSAPIVRDATFQSASLARVMKYRILLPSDYDIRTHRYPVLYLLHGLQGDYTNWDTHTHLREYAAPLQVIIVMPDADNSWYLNSTTHSKDRFEDYVAKDLIAEIDQKYRTIATRESRAIAGLSMGGYGSLKFALKYPNLFVFAGSVSGTVAVAHADYHPQAAERYHQLLQQILGPVGSEPWKANDLFALAKKDDPSRLPYLWLSCGAADLFLEENRRFVELLQQHKIPYTYTEAPGGHSWTFWDDALPVMLRELERHMAIR